MMDIFNSKKKDKALQELEIEQKMYEQIGREAGIAVQTLYNKRKNAVKAIERAEKILMHRPDFGSENIKKIADARSSIRSFTDAIITELEAKESIDASKGKYVGATVAGTAAGTGVAVATLGPTAAMAMATTFGTAATGTAISTLTGAAATNAALAWLGGGAIAAGGGGIASGSAILALAGPVGLAIGGVGVGVGTLLARNKNQKIADAANKLKNEYHTKGRKLRNSVEELVKLSKEIELEIDKQMELLDNIALQKAKDDDNSMNYAQIVMIIISLCKKINRKFTI